MNVRIIIRHSGNHAFTQHVITHAQVQMTLFSFWYREAKGFMNSYAWGLCAFSCSEDYLDCRSQQVDEAWITSIDFKNLYGFPMGSKIERKNVFDSVPVLTKIPLSLARAHMPVPTSMILRVFLERENMPPLHILCSKRSVHAKVVKADAMAFNQVLDACVRFKSSLKGQEIVHLMSQTAAELILDMHKQELVIFWSGKLLLSNRALAKLVNGYRRHGRTSELSKLLLCIQQDFHALSQSSLCSDVD
ncbi:hypothetical protein NC652_001628 [Populus alba x Populus x berolinensis]|nr:hypothetical protein NC652_001628 [Populus alba x Populus x berolinensis]